MFRGATCKAAAIVGTAVFRIVVSSDSMKNATAMSHGRRRLLASARVGGEVEPATGPDEGRLGGIAFGGPGCISLRGCRRQTRNNSIAARFTKNNYRPSVTRLHRGSVKRSCRTCACGTLGVPVPECYVGVACWRLLCELDGFAFRGAGCGCAEVLFWPACWEA